MKSVSDRIITTPSLYAKEYFLYPQETGSLVSREPHISSRNQLNSFLFFLVLSGEGRFFYNNQPFSLKQGNCVWVDCRFPYSHESSLERPWELKWVHFYGRDAAQFYFSYQEQGCPSVFTPANPGGFNEILSSLHALQKKDHPLKDLWSHKYLTDIITLCYGENTNTKTIETITMEKLLSVKEYIRTHHSETLSLSALAENFFISRFHLSREYKKAFGITIGHDITLLRISHAKNLLRFSPHPISEIALLCGFSDANYFSKVFKKSEEMTPLEYRQKW